MDQTKNPQLLTGLLALILVLCGLFTFIQINNSLKTKQSTGTLTVQSSVKNALLTISQQNKNAVVAGSGKATVRLKPGSYLVMATANGESDSKLVQVNSQETTTTNLTPSYNSLIRSVNDLTFSGFDGLIDNGLTDTQVASTKQLIFEYKKTAKNITIDPASIEPGPHDSKGSDPNFSLNLTLLVDTSSYSATISYADLSNVKVSLKDKTTGAIEYSGDSSKTINEAIEGE